MAEKGRDMELILFACFLFGLLGAAIGYFRGRVQVGFFLGLLFGPVGVLIVLCLPDIRLRCPECRGVVPPGARLCLHCRSPLFSEP